MRYDCIEITQGTSCPALHLTGVARMMDKSMFPRQTIEQTKIDAADFRISRDLPYTHDLDALVLCTTPVSMALHPSQISIRLEAL